MHGNGFTEQLPLYRVMYTSCCGYVRWKNKEESHIAGKEDDCSKKKRTVLSLMDCVIYKIHTGKIKHAI